MRNDYDAPEDESLEELYESDGLRWMSVVVVLLVVFGFFSLAWYAYRTSTDDVAEDGELLMVEPDTAPMREEPEERGGMEFPHQDKEVYNRIIADDHTSKPNVERLLPSPEEPIAERNVSAETAQDTSSWINNRIHPGTSLGEAKEVTEEEVSEVKEKAADAASLISESARKAEEVTKAPEETAKKLEPKKAVEPEEKAAALEDVIVQQAEKFSPPPRKEELKVAMKQEPAPVKQPKTIEIDSTSSNASHHVQLAALRSEQEADTIWKKLSAKHGDLLGGMSKKVVRADIPGKGTYYRLRLGVPSKDAGNALCASLKSRGQDCMLVR